MHENRRRDHQSNRDLNHGPSGCEAFHQATVAVIYKWNTATNSWGGGCKFMYAACYITSVFRDVCLYMSGSIQGEMQKWNKRPWKTKVGYERWEESEPGWKLGLLYPGQHWASMLQIWLQSRQLLWQLQGPAWRIYGGIYWQRWDGMILILFSLEHNYLENEKRCGFVI